MLLLALGLAACGAAPGPDQALAGLRDALARRDATAAYALMSSGYRARVPFDRFRAVVEDGGAELDDAMAVLSAVDGPTEIEAHAHLADGTDVVLRSEDGTFHVETDVVDYYAQDTPRSALRSFVRAADHRRFDVLLRLLPRADREALTAEQLAERWASDRERMERIVGALRLALEAPIEISGDRATLIGSGAHATFVLEGDRWVVRDPE